ncbi:MAG: hypothetical protein ACK56I_33180, partial [bacterium]
MALHLAHRHRLGLQRRLEVGLDPRRQRARGHRLGQEADAQHLVAVDGHRRQEELLRGRQPE